MQSDILPATESVHDALLFSAKLKLPRKMSIQEKEDKVLQIINKLKLNDCQNTFIGNDAIRGVSGGEKKRTSVGVELVTDPDLIFLGMLFLFFYILCMYIYAILCYCVHELYAFVICMDLYLWKRKLEYHVT